MRCPSLSSLRLLSTITSVTLLAAGPAAHATGTFALVLGGTTEATVAVEPGASFSLDVLVTGLAGQPGVQPNLDSFTYRVIFPGADHGLEKSGFLAPFDDTPAPGGFNGSIPDGDSSAPITNFADAGSPFATPVVPDLYRTTASILGVPATGPSFVVETLSLQAPTVPGSYAIDISVLEAADQVGAFHTATEGAAFVVEVPEPHVLLQWVAGLVFLVVADRYRGRCRFPAAPAAR
jgi:hypothetical protein